MIAAARSSDKRQLGRLISLVENDESGARAVLGAVYSAAGRSWNTGLTGAPGAGKSTLADLLIAHWRALGRRVAVLAVDPTSPFTGGALLGDRIRMQRGAGDGDVLVRSMATRGRLGGLSPATERVATLVAGLGYDEVLIETVGVGQSEVDIAAAADTTIVVVAPGWGDGVQVAKAGIMEIGDVIVVNKADRAGASETAGDIQEMLRLDSGSGWRPPVVTTTATEGEGISELMEAIHAHRASLTAADSSTRLEERRLRDLRRAFAENVEAAVVPLYEGAVGAEIRRLVVAGELDPWTGASRIVAAARAGY